MNALLVFLAQILASLGAPIVVVESAPVVAPSAVVRPTPPPPLPPVFTTDRDDATQISNGF